MSEYVDLKEKYWKNGNIVIFKYNYDVKKQFSGVISNHLVFLSSGTCHADFEFDADFMLIDENGNCVGEIEAVYENTSENSFILSDIELVKTCCRCIWDKSPEVELTIEEIEDKLGISHGKLKIK